MGALVAIIALKRSRIIRFSGAQWLGIVLLVFSCIFFSEATTFSGFAALLPVSGAALLILGIAGEKAGFPNRLLASRWATVIGDRSYSIYLWHWPVIVFVRDVVGVNSRLDSIQAAVLNAKLPNLYAYNQARIKAANAYDTAFEKEEKIIIPHRDGKEDSHVFHQYTLKIKDADRDELVKHLGEKGIPCGVYYPIPLHLQKAYKDSRYKEEDFPVTNQLVKEVISLPMHTELDKEQIEFITSTIINFVNSNS